VEKKKTMPCQCRQSKDEKQLHVHFQVVDFLKHHGSRGVVKETNYIVGYE